MHVRKSACEETDRETGKSRMHISAKAFNALETDRETKKSRMHISAKAFNALEEG
jgi:hypothetical protein